MISLRPLEYNPRMPARERVYRTEAVVLRRQELGEADRLLTIYTPGYGKLRVVAKGGGRPRPRKAGHPAYAVEGLDCFAVTEENRPLYRLLVETLGRLSEGADPAVVVRHYELRLLEQVGDRPEVFRCVGGERGGWGGRLSPDPGSAWLRGGRRWCVVAGGVVLVGEPLMEGYLTHVLE